MRLPVPPREQRGEEDAWPLTPCKWEFQKNKGVRARDLTPRRMGAFSGAGKGNTLIFLWISSCAKNWNCFEERLKEAKC
jgi:hypothetical protein